MLSPLSLARSSLCRLGREPQCAGVDSVRVNRQDLPVEFLRRGGFLVEPVEVADVPAGFLSYARGRLRSGAFLFPRDGTPVAGLRAIAGRAPCPASIWGPFLPVPGAAGLIPP